MSSLGNNTIAVTLIVSVVYLNFASILIILDVKILILLIESSTFLKNAASMHSAYIRNFSQAMYIYTLKMVMKTSNQLFFSLHSSFIEQFNFTHLFSTYYNMYFAFTLRFFFT